MEQTKLGRACEQELLRFKTLLQTLPHNSVDSSQNPIIQLTDSVEQVSIESLCVSDDALVSEAVEVLAELVDQVNTLTVDATERHFPWLLVFSDDASLVESEECESIALVSSALPSMHHVSLFVGQVYALFRNLIQQIRAFHSLSRNDLLGAGDRVLVTGWRALGDLLGLLIQLDEISINRPSIKLAWRNYMRAVETASHNPSQFGTSPDSLRPLCSALVTIEGHLTTNYALRNCYEQGYGELDDDPAFAVRMKNAVLNLYSRWEKAADADMPDKRRLMGLLGLAVFYHLHFPKPDKKLVKTIWSCHKKIAMFHIMGDLLWVPCSFLLREIPDMDKIADKKSVQFIQTCRQNLSSQCESMIEEAMGYVTQTEHWRIEVRTEMTNTTPDAHSSLKITDIILKGVRLADRLSGMVRTVLNCHSGSLRLSKAVAANVFSIIQAIKSVSTTLGENWWSMCEAALMAGQQWRCHSLSILDKLKGELRDAGEVQRLAAVQICLHSLLATASRTRLAVSAVALDVAQYAKILRGVDVMQLDGLLSRMEVLVRPRKLVERVTDCSFLAFHPSLCAIYWDTYMDRRPSLVETNLWLSAVDDVAQLYVKVCQNGPDNASQDRFLDQFHQQMIKGFLSGLCAAIESDLRVLTHKHLKVDQRDVTTQEHYEFYKALMKSPPWRYGDRIIDCNEFVKRYLEKAFYNLTSVALHDSHTYRKMAALAESRYGLRLIDGNLPCKSQQEGLDVVHVMRTMDRFVQKYNYSINFQMFIEKESSNRSVAVLSLSRITSSLATHGVGVLNTAVNIVYQLLRKKLSVVSKFLSEEHIRAQLQKEARHFEAHRQESKNMFSVSRAEKLNRAIAKLGEEEISFMDKLREVITQMGNALGFVRAMTSSAAALNSQAKTYDHDSLQLDRFDLTNPTTAATNTLKTVLEDLRGQASIHKDFINMLVNVFSNALREDERFRHMALFHLIVPALTLNYIDHMLTCRDRLKKRTQHNKEMTFVDDGFVMGVAYCLSLLDLWPQFSALNWMRSLSKELQGEVTSLEQGLRGVVDERAFRLKLDRCTQTRKEFKLLAYTFQSARVFFSVEDPGEEES